MKAPPVPVPLAVTLYPLFLVLLNTQMLSLRTESDAKFVMVPKARSVSPLICA